jgi:SAM-dependent methyltransferase
MNVSESIFDAVMYPLEAAGLRRHRRSLLRHVSGKVLEIGAGTGANLAHYDMGTVTELTLSDRLLTERIKAAGQTLGNQVTCREADAMDLPFDDRTFDWVVFTLVFCSVPDPARGLQEVRRVLKPDGRFLFIEHVRPSHGLLRHAVEVLNPAWYAVNGECNLNRDTLAEIELAGFAVERLTTRAGGLLVSGTASPLAQWGP